MREIELVFDGRAFPAASVTNHLITVSGRSNGRRWTASKPLAFWRTFAELELTDDAIAGWVARYGDIKSALAPGRSVDTTGWEQLALILALVARAWTKPDDPDGISYIKGEIDAAAIADAARRDVDAPVIFGPSFEPFVHAARLRDFMLVSASFMLRDKTPMRRCAECRHWTAASHAATRYCSNTCRLKAMRKREAA
ncbi:MAG: hypothetical protein EOQ86_19705 [Mesorhizobium sp.]|uniref:hypothetical protein n=1 Tax=Mesorhizobium sp. TaxID=1871066 RepID=UPI000FE8A302|nr:hypothetical protein [Mesorhizobium sp.]RWH76856.1 MAG: hypothetical protein EOQ85_20175 [Mesorhizobium sp.]RWH80165.1 MAG: hypothetical protein EOQ86_19705 [Mesorhizobium sp.]RWH88756.1 MAG: hypothetical protein EOQ87_20375 [Mesorhizobium sp.]RWH95613.1 MAG: hypothetical protein EOQ88_22505 [Mesorhizobium sp.]RWI01298.1 MAG: hypothetical protein EOQ89_16715 [Mesorhizobium sp.]